MSEDEEKKELLTRLANALLVRAGAIAYWKALHHKRSRRLNKKQRRYQYAARRAKKLRNFVKDLRLRGCADCHDYHEGHMSFDHLPEFEKKFDISRGHWKSFKLLAEEIAKTEVVCCRCHDRREKARGRPRGHTCRHPDHKQDKAP